MDSLLAHFEVLEVHQHFSKNCFSNSFTKLAFILEDSLYY